jgi:hypothetical protein
VANSDGFVAKAGALIWVLDWLHSSWFSCCQGRMADGFLRSVLGRRRLFCVCFEVSKLDSLC